MKTISAHPDFSTLAQSFVEANPAGSFFLLAFALGVACFFAKDYL
jgi:hypothetical protein